jgi:hypothetical protein
MTFLLKKTQEASIYIKKQDNIFNIFANSMKQSPFWKSNSKFS